MDAAASADIATQISSGLSTALISMVAAMLTPAIGFLAIVSLMVTQGIKSLLIYFYKSPPAELIWFVIGPVGALYPAKIMWATPGIHWAAAACAASLLANLAYALLIKRVVGTLAPTAYARINAPVNRRKTTGPLPPGGDQRQP